MSRFLGDIAHVRTGDKGSLTTISVTCYDADDYALLAGHLTSELAGRYLGKRIVAVEERFELPQIATVLLVCRRQAQDTVNTSLYLDRHGKTLGSALCDIEL